MKQTLGKAVLAATLALGSIATNAAVPTPYDPYVYNGTTYYIQTYTGLFNQAPSGSSAFYAIGGGDVVAAAVGSDFGIKNANFYQANTNAGPYNFGPIFATFQSGNLSGGYAYDFNSSTVIQAVANFSTPQVWAYYTNSAPAGGYSVAGGAVPEIDGSLAPKVGFLLGCLFLMFGRKGSQHPEASSLAV